MAKKACKSNRVRKAAKQLGKSNSRLAKSKAAKILVLHRYKHH